MAIKYALGVIDNYSERIDSSESTLDDPNGWFDCVTGKPVSNLQAATYDSNLQSYVTRFQLDNQFYILCYLFTKFAIPKNTSRINAFKRAEAYSGPEQGRQDYQKASSVSTWAQGDSSGAVLPGPNGPQVTVDNVQGNARERYKTNPTLSQQIDFIVKLFGSGFGRIGEATLAVMHGWLPRTTIFNERLSV